LRGRADGLDRLNETPGDQVDLPARADGGSRGALLRRLADLPPGHPSATRVDRDSRPDHADDAPDRSFWEKVPRCEALWQSHLRRWPDKPASPEEAARKDDPPGSWRGRGDQYLSPEQNAEADQLIADLRGPEKEVTTLLKQIEQDNPHGGVLAGLEHRFKGTNRLKEKIVERGEHELGISVADAVADIYDAVRYTFLFSGENYVVGSGDIRERLESAGYQMIYSKNHWLDDPEYKGVNTRWNTPTGDRFELQLHTAESFYAKENLTHDSYDRLRAPDSLRAEQRELHSYQRLVCGAIGRPARVHEIADTRKPT